MDFDPRDFDDSRNRDRHKDRGGPRLGRGPSSHDDDAQLDSGDRDDARRSERDHDSRERDDWRDPFTRHVDLPRGPDREIVRDCHHDYSLRGSESRTLTTVGAFRVVSSRDLHDDRDRPLDPRSGDLRHLREQGLVDVTRIPGSRDVAVSLTKDGRSLLENHRDRHQEGRQTFYAGVKRERELEHDVQVYRAYEREAERLHARGARIERVALDYELKREYQRWLHEHDHDCDDYDGHPDRDENERALWAADHDLPWFGGQVHFPDVRIEYEDVDGRHDHVDVEVLTVHYRGAHRAAASRSGFRTYRGSTARMGGSSHLGGLAEEMLR